MENNEMMEDLSNLLTLTDADGNESTFEFLDLIEYNGTEYIVLLPADEESSEVVILEIEPVDEENENYLAVEDMDVLNAVYEIFKEKFKDIITFED